MADPVFAPHAHYYHSNYIASAIEASLDASRSGSFVLNRRHPAGGMVVDRPRSRSPFVPGRRILRMMFSDSPTEEAPSILKTRMLFIQHVGHTPWPLVGTWLLELGFQNQVVAGEHGQHVNY